VWASLLKFQQYRFRNIENDKFISNIKSGKKSFDAGNWMSSLSVRENDMERLRKDTVIEVSTGKIYAVSTLIDTANLFLNFWFKGCKACEIETPNIQQFYNKYSNKIRFLLLSNDSLSVARNYIKEKSLMMPFYVFKNQHFPADIEVFPANHLIINRKTAFYYAGIGYFDNKDFYQYVDSVLTR
jgi:thiol-disulfide isomerase/thioredoxin